MTPSTAHSTAPGPATAGSTEAARLWRRSRGPLLAVALLALAGVVVALLRTGEAGSLHPRSAAPHGSRAIVELLADHGVETTLATTADEAAGAVRRHPDTSTLLVLRADALTGSRLGTLRTSVAASDARTVLVSPSAAALDRFAPHIGLGTPVPVGELAADCRDDAAARAGSASLGGARFVVPALTAGVGCYPYDGLPTQVTVPDPGRGGDTVLLGAPDLLTNEHLDEHGNASLALQVLGTRSHLVWYLPSAADAPAPGEERSFFDQIDDGWFWAAAWLGVAVLLTAYWRGRRLGPVVTEPLPVRIRAAETTEGRARLYHRAGARDHAALALRAATRSRLAPLLGLDPSALRSGQGLAPAVASRTGESPTVVQALLYGPPPADDDALVRLADDLDALERRVSPAASAPDATHPPTDKDRTP